MNVLDSELVAARLRSQGYELTTDIEAADAILYNTCSVRQHAEDKIYSALGRIKHLKRRKPELEIGVLGCMAQKDQEQILKRAPYVDIVVGPGQLAGCRNFWSGPGKRNSRSLRVSLGAPPALVSRSQRALRDTTPIASQRCGLARFRPLSGS